MNPYRVLDVNPGMSLDEIRVKYRQLAKRYHPDGSQGNEAKFREVNEAWKVIKSSKEDFNKQINGVLTHKTLFTFRRLQK